MTNEQRDEYIRNTHDTTVDIARWLKEHTENQAIHQIPPCEAHKTLVARLWGVAVLLAGAALTSLYAVFK